MSAGVKHDADKPRTDLLDPDALEGIARVLGFGAKKYAAHNWRGGISYSRLIGAALRHLFAIMRGEDTDPESGLPHVDHLGCCWMFLSSMMKTRRDLDDRWRPESVACDSSLMQSESPKETHDVNETRDYVLPRGPQAPAAAGLPREDVQSLPGRYPGRLVFGVGGGSLDRIQVDRPLAKVYPNPGRTVAEAAPMDKSSAFRGT